MKNFLYLFVVSLCALLFVGCSEEDNYNADTAITPYEPIAAARKVAQVKTYETIDGRLYSRVHNFVYDAQDRIKQINSTMVHYAEEKFDERTIYFRDNITSQANYYYDNENLKVEYSQTHIFPDDSDRNWKTSGVYRGEFNDNGHLKYFQTLTLDYSSSRLVEANADGGLRIFVNAESGNVAGFVKYGLESTADGEVEKVLLDYSNDYSYSSIRNNTNFDFSAYFGYWGVESAIPGYSPGTYAPFQLGAFGMFGVTSRNLPSDRLARDSEGNLRYDGNKNPVYVEGDWQLDDEGYPILFTESTGRVTEIPYCE